MEKGSETLYLFHTCSLVRLKGIRFSNTRYVKTRQLGHNINGQLAYSIGEKILIEDKGNTSFRNASIYLQVHGVTIRKVTINVFTFVRTSNRVDFYVTK